jgi:hypothetical protein
MSSGTDGKLGNMGSLETREETREAWKQRIEKQRIGKQKVKQREKTT